MSTNTFTDEEVQIILETLKTKANYTTTSEKEKLTIQVEIARKLTKLLKGRRSALQVRCKLTQLQKGYHKLKAKPNHQSAVNKQAVKYFELLDEIFAVDRNQNKKIPSRKIAEIKENQVNDMPTLISKFGIQKSRQGVLKSNDGNGKVRQIAEFADYNFKVPQITKIDAKNSAKAFKPEEHIEKVPEKIGFVKEENPPFNHVHTKFMKEQLASQNLLVAAIKEQDQIFTHSFQAHCKQQAEVLKNDRLKIINILRNDRKEMGRPFSYTAEIENYMKGVEDQT